MHSTESRCADQAVREHGTAQGEQRLTRSTWVVRWLSSHGSPLDETIGEVGRTARDGFWVEERQFGFSQSEVHRLTVLSRVVHVDRVGTTLVTSRPHHDAGFQTSIQSGVNCIAHAESRRSRRTSRHSTCTSNRQQVQWTQGRQVRASSQGQRTVDDWNECHVLSSGVHLESIGTNSARAHASSSIANSASASSGRGSSVSTHSEHQVTTGTSQAGAGLLRPDEGLVVLVGQREATVGHVVGVRVEERPEHRHNVTGLVDDTHSGGIGVAVVDHVRNHETIAERTHGVRLRHTSTQRSGCNGCHCKFFHLLSP